MGECTISSRKDDIPSLEDYSPESCYVSWYIILTTAKTENEIHDIFVFVEDTSELSITAVFEHLDSGNFEDYKQLGEILLDRGDISHDELKNILSSEKKLGENLVLADPNHVMNRICEDQVFPPPETGIRLRTEYIKGIRKYSDIFYPAAGYSPGFFWSGKCHGNSLKIV